MAAAIGANGSVYTPPSLSTITSHAVQRKVGRIRWRPLADPSSSTTSDVTRMVAIGSTGETTNALSLRYFDTTPNTAKPAVASATAADGITPPVERMGEELAMVTHAGDVNDLRFLSSKLLTTASSTGAVRLFEISGGDDDKVESKLGGSSVRRAKKGVALTEIAAADNLHKGPATCMDVVPASGDEPVVVSSGEDGALQFWSPLSNSKRAIANANSGSTYALRFSGVETLLTVGMGGRMGVWDMRTRSTTPATVCLDPNSASLTAVTAHPVRPYTIATGSVEGVLSLWDIRASGTPTVSLQAHQSCIWDLAFTPSLTTSIVTCGEDGSLTMWDFNKTKMDPIKVAFNSTQQDNIHPVQLHSNVLPIRCLDADVNGRSILCGTDSETVLSFSHLVYG